MPTLKESQMEVKKQSISEIIEEVKCEICDNYCKYPDLFTAEEEEVLWGMCEKCPLGRL